MSLLSEHGQTVARETAARHGVSVEAVTVLLRALAEGQGNQAQFNHPDLGGMGQWSRGGMVMVGDMFNNALKARVDALCTELSQQMQSNDIFARAPVRAAQSQSQSSGAPGVSLFVSGMQSGNWWPEELGAPASVGSQNNLRYAFFPAARRLAIDIGGQITVYDTGDHQIGGFSQQQSGDQSLTFTSQRGLVRVADLPKVDTGATPKADPPGPQERAPAASAPEAPDAPSRPAENAPARTAPEPTAAPAAPAPAPTAPAASGSSEDDIIAKIERLATLKEKGILTETEFNAKKVELLSRL